MNTRLRLLSILLVTLVSTAFADVPAPVSALIAEMKEAGAGVRGGVDPNFGVYLVAIGKSRYRPAAINRCREVAETHAKEALSKALQQTIHARDAVALNMSVDSSGEADVSAFVSSLTETAVSMFLKGVQVVSSGRSADGQEMEVVVYATSKQQDATDDLAKTKMKWGDKGVVLAVGIDVDRAMAELNALRSAVEQVAGTLVVGKVSVNEQEDLHKRLATTAGALVEEYRVESETRVEMQFRVEVLAKVDKRKLYDNYRSYFKCLDNPTFSIVASDKALECHFRQFFLDKGFDLTNVPEEAHYLIKLNGRYCERPTLNNKASMGTMLNLAITIETLDGKRTLLTMNEKQAKDSEVLTEEQRHEEVARRIFVKLEERLHRAIQDMVVRMLDDADAQADVKMQTGTSF